MRTKKLLFLLFGFLIISKFSSAQTQEEVKQITAEYDIQRLQSISEHFYQQFLAEKEHALKMAKVLNIPVFIKTEENSAELMKVLDDGTPIYYTTLNIDAAKSTRTNHLQIGGSLGLNLMGQNMKAYIWDKGIARITHKEYSGAGGANRYSVGDGSTTLESHSAHVTGTIIASGKDSKAKGMAPYAKAIGYDWNNDLSEAATAVLSGMLVSNHSYGYITDSLSSYFFGSYTSVAMNCDNLLYNSPYYLMVKAAGNDGSRNAINTNPLDGVSGYDKLTDYGTAKNVLVVANAQDANVDEGGNLVSVSINPGSSQGPTDDYRVKPDIAGNGTELYSTLENANNAYGFKTGTSMASPNVAGTLLLLQQYYKTLNPNYMRAATLKGLVLHTADDAGPVGPDAVWGWGLLNAKKAAEVIKRNGSTTSIEELTLTNGQTYQKTINVSGHTDLKVSISWTDPAGTVNEATNSHAPALVNNLDLIVKKSSGANFLPWKLTGVTTNSKGINNVDPFERVDITNATGTYTIKVTHNGALTYGQQKYSLIVSGLSSCTNCPDYDVALDDMGTDERTITSKLAYNDNCIIYRIPVVAGNFYTINSGCAVSNENEFNPYFELMNQNCVTIASSAPGSNGSPSNCTKLMWESSYTGYAYLRVSSNNISSGEFVIHYNECIPSSDELVPDFDWQTYYSYIPEGTVKAFKINVQNGETYTFKTGCGDGASANFDTMLILRDNQCNTIITGNSGCEQGGTKIVWISNYTGAAYLVVKGQYNSEYGYVNLAFRKGKGEICPEYNESLNISYEWNTKNNSIASSGDFVTYRFEPAVGNRYIFKTGCGDGANANFDSRLELLDEYCNLITQGTNSCSPNGAIIDWVSETNTYIYLRVYGNVNSYGSFTLAYKIEPCLECPYYNNNIYATEGQWNLKSGSVLADGCVLYRMEVQAGKSYTVKTGCGDGATADFDTRLEVLDNNCNSLFLNDDGCEANRSKIDWMSDYTGYVYVRVWGFAGAAGNFVLASTENQICKTCPSYDYDLTPTNAWITDTENILPGGCVIYKVPVQQDKSYTFKTGCGDEATANFDTRLELMDENCNSIAFDDDSCESYRSKITYESNYNGYVYLKVYGYSNSAGIYTLAFREEGCTTCPSYDNELYPIIDEWQLENGNIQAGGCKLYRMEVQAGASYTVKTGCGNGATADFDTQLELLDANCNSIEFTDDSCEYLRSKIEWTSNYTGYIYIKVSGYSAVSGNFTLAYKQESCLNCPSYNDEIFPSQGEWFLQNGNIPSGGCQIYRMEVQAGKSYTVKTGCGDGATANFDTVIEVLNSNCNSIAINNNGCEANRSKIDWISDYTGYVYVKVWGFGDDSGNFVLASTINETCKTCPSYDLTINPTNEWENDFWNIVPWGCRVYQIPVEKYKTYIFKTGCGDEATANFDTRLELMDENCNTLVFDDDSCELFRSKVEWESNYDGFVYLKISGYSNSAGIYALAYKYESESFTITTSSQPAAGGTTNGGGIYELGSTATVTAIPNTGYIFKNWQENGVIVSTNQSYSFTVDGNRSLTAKFKADSGGGTTYTIKTKSSPPDSGTTTGAGSYLQGSTATVTAMPNTGYTFKNWQENGVIVSTDQSYSFTVDGNRSLTAKFKAGGNTTYTITTKSAPEAGGTTTGSGTYSSGSTITVKATANPNYVFESWMEGSTIVATTKNYSFTVTSNRTLKAKFVLKTYTITTKSTPAAGGTTTGDGSYVVGKKATVTATANSGYVFENWLEGTTVVATTNSYKFTVTGNRNLKAKFIRNNNARIAASANLTEAGTITGAGDYSSESLVTLNATTNPAYIFVGWMEDGSLIWTEPEFSFTANENRSLIAYYQRKSDIIETQRALQIYPNPFDDYLMLNAEGHKILKAELYDMSGRLIYSKIINQAFAYKWDTKQIAKGNYLLILYTDKESKSIKVYKK